MQAPFTDIVVPLDGSPTAERALEPARRLAGQAAVPLLLVSRVLPGEAAARRSYLARVVERLATEVDVGALVVDRESIPDAIVGELEPGSLLCISSHGRGGVVRGVLGSVTEAVLRTIEHPALVVGPHAGGPGVLRGRIVACVDGSPESERAVAPAQRWAAAFDLPLWLVEVMDPHALLDRDDAGHVIELARRTDDVRGWDVLHGRSAPRALADLAASETDPVALLVMATHGRTGWSRLRLGSVTTATVHAAGVPVLVVPAGHPERPVRPAPGFVTREPVSG